VIGRWRDWDFGSRGVLALLGLAAVVAFLLYPRPSEITAKPGAPENVTEIVYWAPTSVSESMKAAVGEFEARNHGQYRVVIGSPTARDATGDPTRFLLSVAGGVPPDLIYFDRFAIVEWASRGAFADLTEMIEGSRDLPDGIRKEEYFEPAWMEPIYKGRVYALANSIDTRALYYLRDPLIRAGFVYEADDPEVLAGEEETGEARPPKTWEEALRKRAHCQGRAEADGTVLLEGFIRRPGVNPDVPADAAPDLAKAGVRTGDVAALISKGKVFRGRIGDIDGPGRFRFDLVREQRPGLRSLPSAFVGECEVKIFDRDGYVIRLTRFDPETGLMSTAGFMPFFGNSWLYMYGWLNGAEFMTEDGTQCRLDSPEIVEALQYVVDIYDSIGGYEAARAFQVSSATANASMDLTLLGKVIMRIDGDWYLQTVMAFKPDLAFGVVPAPIPEKRLAAGGEPVGWGGGWAYAIPATAKHKEGAWELMRWLCSVEANAIMADFDASYKRAMGQPFFPSLHPDRRVLDKWRSKYVEGNRSISPYFAEAYRTFVELLPRSKYRPVTPVGQKLWNEHVRAAEAAANHTKPPYEALNYGKRQVQIALERVLNPPTGPLVSWRRVIGAYVAGALLLALGLTVVQERRRRRYGGRRARWFEGFICASPWLTGFLVLGAGPIIFSIVISFCHYDVLNPARFVRFTNYANLLGRHFDPVAGQNVWNDPIFWKSMANTGFMVVSVPLGICAGLALALLLDSKVRGLHVFRTVYYLPAIVPAVAGFILWMWVFDPGRGLLNQALRLLGAEDPPNWLQDPAWAKPALILMGLWAVGGSMIIWLAGLKDIPESLYEAAAIDGADRVQRFRYVTIPLLSPYILFNMIMGLIGVFQIFEAAFIMTDGGPADSTLFYAYKLFNEAFRYLNMGAASAMAWILFAGVLAITLFQLYLSKKWVHYGG